MPGDSVAFRDVVVTSWSHLRGFVRAPRSESATFSKDGEMVHVKRRKGGSSGLSHLFGQAFVSSRMLVAAPAYAPAVRELLTDWGDSVKDPPQPQEHPIVLAVILASEAIGEGAVALPFFSAGRAGNWRGG